MMVEDTSQELRYRFYGYFAALIASVFGHRTGVLVNMTVSEVSAARDNAQPDAHGYVINVSMEVLGHWATMLRWIY